ncbi:diguanylate cyclase [Zavarzinia sp. CC-PAN008]|uniref:sensor domain-containing diguanylate cyclase n=1 Tax=Zavarzinia sp. CC-PAN008 TaxID=3243332 RepID=UPI003F742A1A
MAALPAQDIASGGLDPHGLIGVFPGPAMLVAADGHVRLRNPAAAGIARAWGNGDTRLHDLVEEARSRARPLAELVRLTVAGGNPTTWELTALPLLGQVQAQGRAGPARVDVLLLGRDATLERNLYGALARSRQMFKDLVDCSSDFAWETSEGGTFRYVSQRGALGYSATELDGMPAAILVDRDRSAGAADPFSSPVPLEDEEIWLRGKDGASRCILVSCVPVAGDGDSGPVVRGVCRDITAMRQREADLAEVLERERLVGQIVDAMRNSLEPARALQVAAESLSYATGADYAFVLRADHDGLRLAHRVGVQGREADQILAAVTAQLAIERPAVRDALEGEVGGFGTLAGVAWYDHQMRGALVLARAGATPWRAEDHTLVAAVADQLGIAIAQIGHMEQLERLSRSDELTGLMNRRAFHEELAVRLRQHARSGRPAALLYLDVDNFKPINDRFGHERGDRVLRALGRILVERSRAGDIPVRLGGDEFALWLDDVAEAGAVAKALALQTTQEALMAAAECWDPPLSLSIGIAMIDPAGAESPFDLIARADQAMYAAKRQGKNRYHVSAREPASP